MLKAIVQFICCKKTEADDNFSDDEKMLLESCGQENAKAGYVKQHIMTLNDTALRTYTKHSSAGAILYNFLPLYVLKKTIHLFKENLYDFRRKSNN